MTTGRPLADRDSGGHDRPHQHADLRVGHEQWIGRDLRMNGFLARACAVAAAGVALSTGVVTAASASTGGVPMHPGGFGPAGSAAAREAALRPVSNRDFAGYQAAVRAGSATVSAASFTVPTLSCTAKDRAIAPSTAVWVNNYKTLSAAFVFTGCIHGRAVYFPGLVSNGREFNHTTTPLAAGDVIDMTTKVSTTQTKIIITDVTTGATVQHLGRGASANAAYIGDVAWATRSGAREGVPNFGKLAFTTCLIDAKALGGWHPRKYQRVNGSGTVEISTGGLWPGGTAFTTHYQNS